RQAVARRQDRVRDIMHTLPENAQTAIQESLDETSGGWFYDESTAPLEGAVDVR
ncbi:ABC transporter ATP-binding protein, partial [Rhodococcus jostii]